jgi:hypothetical protein
MSRIPLYLGSNIITVTAWDAAGNNGAGSLSVDLSSQSGGFNYPAYLSANLDLPRTWGKAECISHYIHYGFAENRAVCLNLEEYLNANPDLPRNWSYADALSHYNTFGRYEKRLPAFDAGEYLSLYPDLPRTWGQAEAFSHYCYYGKREGRVYDPYDESVFE